MLKRLPALGIVLAAIITAVSYGTSPADAQSATASLATLKLPFTAGTGWKAIQGYNGGTHTPGPEFYALDLVRDGGRTGGADVIAPASGSLWFAHAPGAGNGCASIKIDGGGGLIVQMCHIILDRVMRPDEPVTAGMRMGVVGEDGRVGNNGTAHLHLSMHRTGDYGVTRSPVPFANGNGISLEGRNLPADGSRNQYACPSANCVQAMMSTNGSASGTTPAMPTTPTTPAAPIAPGVPAPRPATPSAPGPLRAGVRAVVANAGAGDCVNIREGPGLNAKVVRCLPDGARLRIVEGPSSADGMSWWRLEDLGWAAATYLSALPSTLEAGARARATPGPGECLNVRAAPSKDARITACLPHGTAVRIEGGPTEADSITWWRIEGGGWASGEFLTAED